jgi:hypothetical protein
VVNLGLVGALSGAGEGMFALGQDILKRREQALEWARQEAILQRQSAARAKEKADDREFQVQSILYREDRADKRDAENRQARIDDREDTQAFQQGQTQYTQGQINERHTDSQASQAENRAEARKLREEARQQRENKPAAAAISNEEKAEFGASLRSLQENLSGNDSQTAKNLRQLIDSSGAIGVKLGQVNEQGYGRLFFVGPDGRLKPSGRFIHQSLLGGDDDDGL